MTETITYVAMGMGCLILLTSLYKFARSSLPDIHPWHSGTISLTGIVLLSFGLFSEITLNLSDDQSISLKRQVDQLATRLTEVKGDVAAATSRSADATQAVRALQDTVETKVATVERLKTEIADTVTDAVAAKIDVPRIKSFSNSVTAIDGLKTRVDALSVRSDSQAKKVANLSTQLKSVDEKLDKLLQRPAPSAPPAPLEEGVIGIVYFGHDSTALSRDTKASLDAMAAKLRQQIPDRIIVAGHADRSGNPTYNRNLAKQRATAVADYLIALGLPQEKFTIDGLGDSDPAVITARDTRETFNRRVVIRTE